MLTLSPEPVSIDDVLYAISRSDDAELSEIIRTVIHTYASRYPDQEFTVLSLPKNDPDERRRILDALIDLVPK